MAKKQTRFTFLKIDHIPDIYVERNVRSKRLRLQIDAINKRVLLRVPPRVPSSKIEEFVISHQQWIRDHLASIPDTTPLHDGHSFPFQGKRILIKWDKSTLQPYLQHNILYVGGRQEDVDLKVKRWLKQEAYKVFHQLSTEKSLKIGKNFSALRLNDTISRWGSCTSKGTLTYSWRIIMAPYEVIDYLCAHEVAHLAYLDHSKKFWDTCQKLTPHTYFGKKWLKEKGDSLHRIGK